MVHQGGGTTFHYGKDRRGKNIEIVNRVAEGICFMSQ